MSSYFVALALVVLALFSLRFVNSPEKDLASENTRGSQQDFNLEAAEELVPAKSRPVPPSVIDIPEYYHDLRLSLLVRDPKWLFAYWEINPDFWRDISQQHGRLARYENITLRIMELANEMAYFDIRVGNLIGSWHIQVPRPDTPYYGILGLSNGGEFIPLLMSNTVITPRNDLSALGDEEWMLVSEYEQKIIKRIGLIPFDATSPFMFRKDDISKDGDHDQKKQKP